MIRQIIIGVTKHTSTPGFGIGNQEPGALARHQPVTVTGGGGLRQRLIAPLISIGAT